MLSEDPDTATIQTVQEMCRQIHQAAKDPLIAQIARRAVTTFRGGPGWALHYSDSEAQRAAESCWWWCKWNLKFKHHGDMFTMWSSDLGDPRTKLQLLIAPDVLVRMKRMEGDCAIYTMMLCALLESLGLPWEIMTLAVDHEQPEIFSHVCARSNGETLDASHGPRPGWEVPAFDVHRRWVFNSNGAKTEYGGRFTGLHAYRSRARRRSMWGMGDFCDEFPEECGQTSASSATLPYYEATQVFQENPVPYSGTVYTAPSQSNSAQWASFATQLAKMGLSLAQINAIQPGTVVSANGAILRQNPGYAVPVGSGTSQRASSLGGNTLLYIGGGLLALLAVGSMMGKR
jgi:hypothetical protein